MTYAQRDVSIDDSAPIEFYEFVTPLAVYRYHDSDANNTLVFRGVEYKSLIIVRGPIDIGSKSVEQNIDISIPFIAQLAKDVAFLKDVTSLTVRIDRAHLGEFGDYRTIWTGTGTAYKSAGVETVISTKQGQRKRGTGNGLLGTFVQLTCNHEIYGDLCKASRAAHTTTSTIVLIGEKAVTVADDGVDDDQLKAGVMVNTRTGEARMMTGNQSNVIGLTAPFNDLLIGDTVEMSKGCMLTWRMCRDTFDNSDNFGGFPYVPRELPTSG